MQPRRRLVQHIDHTEQLRPQLSRQAQALQLARGQGWGTALQGQVAQPQVDQGTDPLQQVLGDTLRRQALLRRQRHHTPWRPGVSRHGLEHLGQLQQRHACQFTDIHPGERHRQRLALEPLAFAQRAWTATHELPHALFISALWVWAKVCST